MNTTNTLATYYPVVRDNNVNFIERSHKYIIGDDTKSKYTSVTSFVHNHFSKFDADAIIGKMMNSNKWNDTHKYWGKSPLEIKATWSKATAAGTHLHNKIEHFMNNPELEMGYKHKQLYDKYLTTITATATATATDNNELLDKDFELFIKFITDFPDLKPYRTEWRVYDEEIKIAGSIDMMYENEDGTLSIYDWKRCGDINAPHVTWNKFSSTEGITHVPDTNYWHYALQLNVYKYIVETKYNKTVTELKLIQIHPDNTSNSYNIIDLPIMTDEIQKLVEMRQQELNIIG